MCTCLLTSCTKFGKNISVKGRVLNPVTGEGIAGVELILWRSTMGLPGGAKAVKKVKTESDGSFELDKFSLRAEELQCNLSGDYFPLGWTSDNGQTFITTNTYDLRVTKGKKQQADYWAVPYGYMVLDISNVNCAGTNDSMQFTRKYQFDADYRAYSTFRTGCYDYVSPEPFQLPIGFHYYKTKVVRNGTTTIVYDTVYVSESGVSTCVIDY